MTTPHDGTATDWSTFAPVVTVTHDGSIVYWYRTEYGAACGNAIVSASRSGVSVNVDGLTVQESKQLAALICHAAEVAHLRRYDNDVRDLATHERRFGRVVPLAAAPSVGE